MFLLRRLALNHRALAGALIALAMMMKVLVPGGFMPAYEHGRIVISICSGSAPMSMVMVIPDVDHGKPGHDESQKPEHPCAFAGLTAHSLAAADPVLLALALVFAIALALRPMAPPVARQRPYLRPPLRAPPVRL